MDIDERTQLLMIFIAEQHVLLVAGVFPPLLATIMAARLAVISAVVAIDIGETDPDQFAKKCIELGKTHSVLVRLATEADIQQNKHSDIPEPFAKFLSSMDDDDDDVKPN